MREAFSGKLAIREAIANKCGYALVPNDSLEETVRARARKIGLRDLGRVTHTIKLEAQETPDGLTNDRVEQHIRDNVSERDLWND